MNRYPIQNMNPISGSTVPDNSGETHVSMFYNYNKQ